MAWTTSATGIQCICVGDCDGDVAGEAEVDAGDDDIEIGDLSWAAWQPARRTASRTAAPARAPISPA